MIVETGEEYLNRIHKGKAEAAKTAASKAEVEAKEAEKEAALARTKNPMKPSGKLSK